MMSLCGEVIQSQTSSYIKVGLIREETIRGGVWHILEYVVANGLEFSNGMFPHGNAINQEVDGFMRPDSVICMEHPFNMDVSKRMEWEHNIGVKTGGADANDVEVLATIEKYK